MPGQHASPTRDYEYKRLGTVSLLAGLDLHRGTVTEIISETHKSKDFIELLKKLDAAYPATTTLRLILDNHSAHISKETQRYLASRPQRFQFVFVPKHGSWLNSVHRMGPSAFSYSVGVPECLAYAAEYPARTLPCQRFDAALASGSA